MVATSCFSLAPIAATTASEPPTNASEPPTNASEPPTNASEPPTTASEPQTTATIAETSIAPSPSTITTEMTATPLAIETDHEATLFVMTTAEAGDVGSSSIAGVAVGVVLGIGIALLLVGITISVVITTARRRSSWKLRQSDTGAGAGMSFRNEVYEMAGESKFVPSHKINIFICQTIQLWSMLPISRSSSLFSTIMDPL